MIYDNVKRLCDEKGITIQKLEKDTGLSNGAVSKWNTSDPGVSKVKLAADYLGVSIENLIRAGEENYVSS